MRAFVAVEIPPETRADLSGLAMALKKEAKGYRFSDLGTLHVTLKFLGEVETERFEAAGRLIAGGVDAGGPFPLKPAGLGGFPSPGSARVVFVGLKGDIEALKKLASGVDELLRPLGFDREKRPYSPHLTIGRAKGDGRPQGIHLLAEKYADFEGAGFMVGEITLFESMLGPGGARHVAHVRGPVL